MRSPVYLFLAALLPFAACRCEPEAPTQQFGEIGIVYTLDGVQVTRANGAYHFRGIPMGVTRTLELTVKNQGGGALDLVSLERVGGDDVFTVDFAPVTLSGGETGTFTITFPTPVTDADHDYTSAWVLTATNTGMNPASADITIDGAAIKTECALPETIDFGGVAVGATATRTLHFENRTSLDELGTLGELTSSNGDHLAFAYGPGWAAGPLPLVSGAVQDVTFKFTPSQMQGYLALVRMRPAAHCPEATIKVIGAGVTAALECSAVDYGWLPPALRVSKEATITNYALEDVSLTAMQASTSDFAPSMSTLTVPRAKRELVNGTVTLTPGTATLSIEFKPTKLGVLTATVTGTTSLAAQPHLACTVKGMGGGPDIELKPSTGIDFGAVPYFTNAAMPFFSTRKMTVQNLGTSPTPPDIRANLRLGVDGAPPQFFRVTPKNANSSADEICVGAYDPTNPNPALRCSNAPPTSYDALLGIQATGAAGLLDIPIRVTPNAANKSMEWEVEVFSNDPDEPVVKTTVRAHSVVLPPCLFSVTPANLNFGLVTPPFSQDLQFVIKNLGPGAADTCLITHLDLAPGADATFSLPAGELDQRTLVGGETLNVVVRATGTGIASSTLRQVAAAVRFGISSPTLPQNDVLVTAAIGLACLTVSPADLDFGTVQQGCASDRRVFNIYNTCLNPVTVTTWRISAGAPEFYIDGTPGFTMGGQIPSSSAMPSTFALRYRPADLGFDRGAFALDIVQNGQPVTQLVTLRGTGDVVGLNTDTFAQDPRPKADILWIIDSSCSMRDKQNLLSMNFAAFSQYANTAVVGGIDYQMGVVDSDPNTVSIGRLQGDALNPKVLRAGMTNVDALFRSKVRVGTSGSGDEHFGDVAVKALSAPLVNTDNAGFLRPDAVLAVIAVTDAGDQSQLPSAVLQGLLRNVKGAQRPGMFSYNVIGPFSQSHPPDCDYDDFTDLLLHNEMVTAFNGQKGQICMQDWATTLTQIGKTAFGYRDRFYLNAQPDLAAMPQFTIKLDNIPVPMTDMSGGNVWTYEASTNSVLFTSANVPEPGQTLTISYHVLCN